MSSTLSPHINFLILLFSSIFSIIIYIFLSFEKLENYTRYIYSFFQQQNNFNFSQKCNERPQNQTGPDLTSRVTKSQRSRTCAYCAMVSTIRMPLSMHLYAETYQEDRKNDPKRRATLHSTYMKKC